MTLPEIEKPVNVCGQALSMPIVRLSITPIALDNFLYGIISRDRAASRRKLQFATTIPMRFKNRSPALQAGEELRGNIGLFQPFNAEQPESIFFVDWFRRASLHFMDKVLFKSNFSIVNPLAFLEPVNIAWRNLR